MDPVLALVGDPNADDALHRAVELGRADVVAALLAAGADPRREDEAGMTPLHLAARRSLERELPPSLIDELIRYGAAPDGGSAAATPLLLGVEDGQLEQVERLIAHGARVDAVIAGATRRSALHLAFERGDDAMTRLLLEHGADRSARDHTGLDLTTVFGPWGEDARPVRVRYEPSVELQRLEVKVTLAVLHPAHVAHYVRDEFDAERWARLVRCGVAGGDLFAPESGCAEAVSSLDLSGLNEAGVVERSLAIDVACVAPAFVAMMARALLGTPTTPTGARAFAPVRVVGLEIDGGADARTILDRPSFDVLARAPLPAYDTDELSFAVHVVAGPAPSLEIVASSPPSDAETRAIVAHAEAWLAMQTTWRTTDAHDATPVSLVSQSYSVAAPVLPLVRLGKTGALAKLFPYEIACARATLANAMRALSARVPLAEVVLTLPGSPS